MSSDSDIEITADRKPTMTFYIHEGYESLLCKEGNNFKKSAPFLLVEKKITKKVIKVLTSNGTFKKLTRSDKERKVINIILKSKNINVFKLSDLQELTEYLFKNNDYDIIMLFLQNRDNDFINNYVLNKIIKIVINNYDTIDYDYHKIENDIMILFNNLMMNFIIREHSYTMTDFKKFYNYDLLDKINGIDMDKKAIDHVICEMIKKCEQFIVN